MTILVQKYLETHTFADLFKDHGVNVSFDKMGYKFSLSYDQIEAKDADVLAQQCRGIILSTDSGKSFSNQATLTPMDRLDYSNVCPGETIVLAYGMNRFFNYGQGSAAEIDWDSAVIYEKLDGTHIFLYYDLFKTEWCTATRSSPDADIPLECAKFTFRTLFEKALFDTCRQSFDDYTSKLDKEITYCFELTSPLNRIVVKYDDYRVTLLAARQNIYTISAHWQSNSTPTQYHGCSELDINLINSHDVPKVKSYNLKTIDDIISFVNEQSPMNHEGIVVKDKNFNRIKIKNASYCAFSRARDVLGSSERAILTLILNEKEDDVIPFMPQEIVDDIIVMKPKVAALLKSVDECYEIIDAKASAADDLRALGWNERKIFAKFVIEANRWHAPFFERKAGKCENIRDFLKKKRINAEWSNSFLDNILEHIK